MAVQLQLEFNVGRTLRRCHACGRMFMPRATYSVALRFCSWKCLDNGTGKPSRCTYCGKDFKYRSGGGSGKFCSLKCHFSSRNKPTPKPCEHCRVPFVKRDAATTKQKRFCSPKCAAVHRSEMNRSVRFFSRIADRRQDWPEVAASVRRAADGRCEVDGCTCQLKQRPSVDHIVPYRYLLKLLESDPSVKPNDVANLFALCRSHHTRKTAMEVHMFRGDTARFVEAVSKYIPRERVIGALRLYGLVS